MGLFIRTAAALAIVGAFTALPANAQSARPAATSIHSTASVCVRDLGSKQCGRFQDKLISAAAHRAGDAAHSIAIAEIGRRQLDVLIDSIS